MNNLADLKKIREQANPEKFTKKVVVWMATSGIAAGARDVMKKLIEEVSANGLTDVVITQNAEKGTAANEPVVQVFVDGQPAVMYGNVTEAIAQKIVTCHLIKGEKVTDFLV